MDLMILECSVFADGFKGATYDLLSMDAGLVPVLFVLLVLFVILVLFITDDFEISKKRSIEKS
jgi:sorbitol-specific phosphotransferase system component IIC